MTARVSPLATAAPSEIGSSATVPFLWAVISFSIFMASMMQMSAPSSTSAPCSTSTLKTLPCSGEVRVSPLAPPPELALRSRRGAGRAPLLAAAGPVASPRTLTSKRLPETSTV